MSGQPAKHLKAVTWRLDRDLLAGIQAAAAARGEPVVGLVARALRGELDRLAGLDDNHG